MDVIHLLHVVHIGHDGLVTTALGAASALMAPGGWGVYCKCPSRQPDTLR